MAHDSLAPNSLPESLLKTVLAPLFPERVIASVESARIRSFQHELYHLKARFAGGGRAEELFFRLYAGNFTWWELFTDLRTKEQEAFAYLAQLGFPAPDFLLRSEAPPIAIARRVPGTPVAENLSPDAVANVAACLAALHARSHACPPASPAFPDLSLPTLFDRLRGWSEEIGDPCVSNLVAWAERGLANEEEERAFLHGDCNAKNFLATPNGIVMLDLEECGRGDPRIDLATMLTNLPREGSFDARAEFLRAYECASGKKLASLAPWMNLIDVRDIVTARVVEARLARGQAIPRFNSALWSKYARELYPNVLKRVN
jgi:aminoglycoside phosphotransferase (APT) family kinase protein